MIDIDSIEHRAKILSRFGIPWRDEAAMCRLLFEELPRAIAADPAYRNAIRAESCARDRKEARGNQQNARLELERALRETVAAWVADALTLATTFDGDPAFKQRLSDDCFERTYPGGGPDAGAADRGKRG